MAVGGRRVERCRPLTWKCPKEEKTKSALVVMCTGGEFFQSVFLPCPVESSPQLAPETGSGKGKLYPCSNSAMHLFSVLPLVPFPPLSVQARSSPLGQLETPSQCIFQRGSNFWVGVSCIFLRQKLEAVGTAGSHFWVGVSTRFAPSQLPQASAFFNAVRTSGSGFPRA